MNIHSREYPKQVVNGQWAVRFIFIAGRLSLDFAHTGGPNERAVWERLNQPSDLADWLAECPLQLTGVEVMQSDLGAALALREAIWQTAVAIRQSLPPDARDIEIINRIAAAPDLAPQIAADGLTYGWRTPSTVRAALSTIARDAIDLFSGDLRGRIRKCENPTCALMFVDSSRPGKRRWCHMDRCGNRVKTARYRHRRAEREKR